MLINEQIIRWEVHFDTALPNEVPHDFDLFLAGVAAKAIHLIEHHYAGLLLSLNAPDEL